MNVFLFTVKFRSSPGIPVYVKTMRVQDAERFLNQRYPDAEVTYERILSVDHKYDFEC